MTVQKFLHSCLLVENGGTRILFDPGVFSFIEGKVKPEDFSHIDAILITHEHSDHVSVPALKIILKNNPGAGVYGNASVVELLKKEGIGVHLFEEGERMIGETQLRAIFAQHGTILGPTPKNTAYVVNNTLLVTGDSYDEILADIKGIKVLALPITAPWLRAIDMLELAETIGAKTVIPVHDAFIKDFFIQGQYQNYAKRFEKLDIAFRPLGIGEVLEV